jgi:hypothetical protein
LGAKSERVERELEGKLPPFSSFLKIVFPHVLLQRRQQHQVVVTFFFVFEKKKDDDNTLLFFSLLVL